MRTLGIIPARAGSQRFPGKNLALLQGRPLIAYACQAAIDSGVLSAVYSNTDSADIAASAERCGVSCPVLRPAHLATAQASTRDANRFLMEHVAARGERYDAVVVLQPTSPLRDAEDIRAAIALFEQNAPCAVVSVSPAAPASWLGNIGKDGRFEPLTFGETIYRLNGAIYIYAWHDYLQEREPPRTLAYCMPPQRGIDVDTPEDLQHAEYILRSRRNEPARRAG